MPHPLGRTFSGEIDEADALSRRARLEATRLRRDVGRQLATARQAYDSRREAAAAFRPERVEATRAMLRDIADEVAAGRLSIRDAVVTQQALIEFLRAHVDARRELCLASVELARAAGASLEEKAQ